MLSEAMNPVLQWTVHTTADALSEHSPVLALGGITAKIVGLLHLFRIQEKLALVSLVYTSEAETADVEQ